MAPIHSAPSQRHHGRTHQRGHGPNGVPPKRSSYSFISLFRLLGQAPRHIIAFVICR